MSVEDRGSERGSVENKPRPASMEMRMAGVKRLEEMDDAESTWQAPSTNFIRIAQRTMETAAMLHIHRNPGLHSISFGRSPNQTSCLDFDSPYRKLGKWAVELAHNGERLCVKHAGQVNQASQPKERREIHRVDAGTCCVSSHEWKVVGDSDVEGDHA
jgi:hypothetical protein